MAVEEKAYCPYCMAQVNPGESCSQCGLTAGTYTPAPHHLPPQTALMDRYLIGRALGEGGFGITYLGRDLRLPAPEATAAETEKPYDLGSIRVFADNDKAAVAQITEAFLADCRTNFDLLRQHLEAGDMAKISKLAHKMIPMFKQFGIREITPLLVFLERMDAAAVDRENVAETVASILEKGPEVADLIRRDVGLPE